MGFGCEATRLQALTWIEHLGGPDAAQRLRAGSRRIWA